MKQVYGFGPYRMDVAARQLWRGSEIVPLTPRVFDTLRYMVQNPGRLLSKEEMLKAIWPDRFVEEANLTQNVSVLRRALREAESRRQFIATFHGRGYQFAAPVQVFQVPEPPPGADSAQPRRRRLVLIAAGCAAILGAIPAWRWLSGNPQPPVTTRLGLPLTRLPGGETLPVCSRDGRKVAFIWDREQTGGPAVLVKGPDDDDPRIVTSGERAHSSPAWSPDGRQLAYLRHDRNALALIVKSERGGDERVVTQLYPTRYGLNCAHLDWSPDGSQLLVDDKQNPDEPLALFLMNVATGARTRVTRPDEDIIGDVSGRFSPDGRTISFIRMTDRFRHELATVPVRGGRVRLWTRDLKKISAQDWTPDGQHLVFASNRGGDFRLWRLRLRDRNLTPLAVANLNPIQFSIARTGSRLVYSAVQQDLNVWRLDLQSLGTGRAWQRIIASTAEDILPQLSPDGTRLCFQSDRSGEAQLWISDADGRNPVQLTRGSGRPVAGRWSPDGRRITYNEADGLKLLVVDAAGGVPKEVGGQVRGSHPAFSADGRRLLVSSNGLLVMDLDGSNARLLLKPPIHQKFLLPGGRSMYYTAGRTDREIRSFDFARGTVREIVKGLLPGYWGAWAASERGIYHLGEDHTGTGHAAIRFHDVRTGRDTLVAAFPGPLPPIGTSMWDLTPDGRYLYCVRVDVSAGDLRDVRDLEALRGGE